MFVPHNDIKESSKFQKVFNTENCHCESTFCGSSDFLTICSGGCEPTIDLEERENKYLTVVSFWLYFYGTEKNQELIVMIFNEKENCFEEFKIFRDSLSDKISEDGFRVQQVKVSLGLSVKKLKLKKTGSLNVGISHFSTKSVACPPGSSKSSTNSRLCSCQNGYFEMDKSYCGFVCQKCPPYCVTCDSGGFCSQTETFKNSKINKNLKK